MAPGFALKEFHLIQSILASFRIRLKLLMRFLRTFFQWTFHYCKNFYWRVWSADGGGRRSGRSRVCVFRWAESDVRRVASQRASQRTVTARSFDLEPDLPQSRSESEESTADDHFAMLNAYCADLGQVSCVIFTPCFSMTL